VVDYKNNQLNKLVEFIEKQEIWKTKFSTASNINYSPYKHENLNKFTEDLERSEEYHGLNSFAGQNRNSFYYISNSGLSLRIKMGKLHPNGNIREALKRPNELCVCLDEVTDPDYRPKSTKDSFEIKSEFISFVPKVGFRVEEFLTRDF